VSPETTDFLYPFIEGDERDPGSLLAALSASAETKAAESHSLARATLAAMDTELDLAARAMAQRFARGGRLFSFGNGGSATDAAIVVDVFSSGTPPLPARSLVADPAVLTALGNDVGFDLVFSRQLIAYAGVDDMAVGLSTSGNSANVIAAFVEARRRGLLTVGFAGYDGGDMATCGAVDHVLVVRSDSVHRIQETQDALIAALALRVLGHLELVEQKGADA
jgi:D-sedoheptulose 7-phosphate isomerase